MYILTSKALGQVSMRYGSYAGTLGEPSPQDFHQIYRAFLNKMRERSSAYGIGLWDPGLLLTVMLHPKPEVSGTFTDTLVRESPKMDIVEALLMTNRSLIDGVNDLRRIGFDLLGKNDRFRRLFEDQKQLRSEVARSIGSKGIEGLKMIKPLLLKTLLELDYTGGSPFLLKLFEIMTDCDKIPKLLPMLPPKLCERIRFSSGAGEAQIAALGGALQVAGRILMERDPAFKKEVELERKKRAPVKKK